jgi:hypothetical protein
MSYTTFSFPPKLVHCLLCNSIATLKGTKTGHLMLRCDSCGVLVYANQPPSQQRLANLPDYINPNSFFYRM